MRALDYTFRDDDEILSKVVVAYVNIAPFRQQIGAAYISYVGTMCAGINPIALSDEAARSLRLAYRSEAQSAGLEWISSLRDDHDFNFCPICGGPGGRTVEHHLPQAVFPEFSVYSYNLLPCCASCNTKRGDWNRPGNDWTLHPYFDREILESAQLCVNIAPPWEAPLFRWDIVPSHDQNFDRRVRSHLTQSLDLSLFASWMRGQWSDLRTMKVQRFDDPISLERSLRWELAAESIRNKNSWNAALVRGVLQAEGLLDWLIENKAVEVSG